jgi:hypothetical protein
MIATRDRAWLLYITTYRSTPETHMLKVRVLPLFRCCTAIIVSPSWAPACTDNQKSRPMSRTTCRCDPALGEMNKVYRKRIHVTYPKFHDDSSSKACIGMSSPSPAASTHLQQQCSSITNRRSSTTSHGVYSLSKKKSWHLHLWTEGTYVVIWSAIPGFLLVWSCRC